MENIFDAPAEPNRDLCYIDEIFIGEKSLLKLATFFHLHSEECHRQNLYLWQWNLIARFCHDSPQFSPQING